MVSMGSENPPPPCLIWLIFFDLQISSSSSILVVVLDLGKRRPCNFENIQEHNKLILASSSKAEAILTGSLVVELQYKFYRVEKSMAGIRTQESFNNCIYDECVYNASRGGWKAVLSYKPCREVIRCTEAAIRTSCTFYPEILEY